MKKIFDFFKKNAETQIKNWMQKMHHLFPDASLSLKINKDIAVIVCDEKTESKKEFRDVALDFLICYNNTFKNRDIIIVSDKDKFYHFDTFDYVIRPQRIEAEAMLFRTFKLSVTPMPDISVDYKLDSSLKKINNVEVSSSEWETIDCPLHSYSI